MTKYYIVLPDGTQKGPVLEQNLVTMVKTGKISTSTLCWKEGMGDWEPLGEVIALPEVRGEEKEAVGAEKKEALAKVLSAEFRKKAKSSLLNVWQQTKLHSVKASRAIYGKMSVSFVKMLRERQQLSGCSGRAEYWWAYAGIMLCYLVVNLLYGICNSLLSFCPWEHVVGIIKMVMALPIVVGWCYLMRSIVALSVRRLRDAGLSTRWALLLIVHPFNFVYITAALMLMAELGGSVIGSYVFLCLTLGSFLFSVVTAALPTKSSICGDEGSLMPEN